MSTAILISSSPPMFARDTTPVDDSPAPKPRALALNEPTSSPKRFKTTTIARDGFASGFSSARSLLAVKPHAENLPLNTPGKERFKSVGLSPKRRSPPFSLPCERPKIDALSHAPSQAVDHHNRQSGAESTLIDHEQSVRPTTPLASIHETVPRRLDWTPAKDDEVFEVSSTSPKADVKPGLMSSFGFKATAVEKAPERSDGTGVAITKRQRMELIEGPRYALVRAESVPAPVQRLSKPVAKKKSKAAPKKAKTITDLVTSHHSGPARLESPMAEFLVATQAKTREAVSASEDNIEVATRGTKRKAASKKTQTRKKPLLSPTSAIKAFDQQETLFGSASQLVGDGPKSFMELSSDPVSPLRTQPTSVGSITPHANRGSSRFVNRRNLWGAADRDEDNALLYVDSVDLFDTPQAQIPLAGKAVLLDSEKRRHSKPWNTTAASESNQSYGQSVASLPKAPDNDLIVDVDDFSSPAARLQHGPQFTVEKNARPSHAMAAQPLSTNATMSANMGAPHPETSNARESSTSARPKPSYAGMQTGELQKLIKGYGFKAIKGRQKMVDLLNKCWDEKEARRLDHEQHTIEADPQILLKQSDFISNVHDLSNRPVPKIKKAARKEKAKVKPKSPQKEPKEPKKRRKVSEKTGSVTEPKKSRGRKPKAALSEERVLDIDDIDEDSTTLTILREEGPKMQQKARSRSPSVNLRVSEASGGAMNRDEASAQKSSTGGPSDTPDRPDMGQQIHAAILHQSEQAAEDDSWNHVRAPTWHEKMLMYDPIIIEDLARWLNAEGLDKVHEDREVTTVDVRDWCESKGVCCMWKGGWRGQASKGGTD